MKLLRVTSKLIIHLVSSPLSYFLELSVTLMHFNLTLVIRSLAWKCAFQSESLPGTQLIRNLVVLS